MRDLGFDFPRGQEYLFWRQQGTTQVVPSLFIALQNFVEKMFCGLAIGRGIDDQGIGWQVIKQGAGLFEKQR